VTALVIGAVVMPTTARADRVQAPPPAPPEAPAQLDPDSPEEMTDADPDRPAPAGYTRVTKRRRGLIVAGGLTFGLSYGLCVISAEIARMGTPTPTSTPDDVLFIPFVGPFIELGRTSGGSAVLVGLGLAQITGAAMIGIGIATRKHLFVRNDQLTIAPLLIPNAGGLSVAGRF
jgi:hypothetical protein